MTIEFSERAAEHDAAGSYPFEAIQSLLAAGFFRAPIPEQYGGLGVASVHDLVVASGVLARGDPSVAIGLNMHLSVVGNMSRRWYMAGAKGDLRRFEQASSAMEAVVRDQLIIATAISERNQELTRPLATAERVQDGWVLNGHKIFCTMAPAANLFFVTVSFTGPEGKQLFGYPRIPRDTPGLVIHDDWDALGMRASGSNSISLENVRIPASGLPGGFEAGKPTSGFLEGNLTAGLYHASSSLGIAESAHDYLVEYIMRKVGPEDTRKVGQLAESAVEVAAMRAMLSHTGDLVDDYYATHLIENGTLEEVAAIFAQVQAAKAFINETAVRVVDRSMALTGGSGYLNKSPLSRAYRDVRAGAFIHPLGSNRANGFIGTVELGVEPTLG